MKKNQKMILGLALILITAIPLVPRYATAWKQEDSSGLVWTNPKFTTHQWIAYEALLSSDTPTEFTWILNFWSDFPLYFWRGVEAPIKASAGLDIIPNYAALYGDLYDYHMYLDASGTTVTNDSLAVRAQEEYDRLYDALNQSDFVKAAFYAGALSHYVSQAGFWGGIWDPAVWGSYTLSVWNDFEDAIEEGCVATNLETSYWYTVSGWKNSYFNLTPGVGAPKTAYDATIDLAQAIHPFAQSLHDDFNATATVPEWETTYYDNVKLALEYSVEAVYSALKGAMQEINWKYISIPDTDYYYNDTDGYFEIDDFQVNFGNNTGDSYILNNATATKAQFTFGYFPKVTTTSVATLSEERFDLEYNVSTQSWYYPYGRLTGTVAKNTHRIYYLFDMNDSIETVSLGTETFYVDFFLTNITRCSYGYNNVTRSISIWNVTAEVVDLPDIGFLTPDEVDVAEWILYQKGAGAVQPGTEAVGVPAQDTEGYYPKGNLTYNPIYEFWESYDNDIGWVYTPVGVEYYIVVRFRINDLPIGYNRYTTLNETIFVPYGQYTGKIFFRTRDHNVIVSAPDIVYDPENRTIEVFNITARTDYKNIVLDYYQIVEKPVPGTFTDTREAKVKIFLYDGIPSAIWKDLTWDNDTQTWYATNISVAQLPDNIYYAAALIRNMNVNATSEGLYGPGSTPFEVVRPLPVVYYILPEIFLAGFVVLFGWLAWYRPRKKRQRIEREREEKLDKGFMD
ncbi:MAG: hypothetical protein FK734_17645 [Asgard group archaeon]|nr:hypothetical protein [Asgard group archaeon]